MVISTGAVGIIFVVVVIYKKPPILHDAEDGGSSDGMI